MKFWYQKHPLGYLLSPLGYLYGLGMLLRNKMYAVGMKQSYTAPVPVVIVGNITVGGTGKTPLLIHLCQLLKIKGYRPGIVSRGYKATIKQFPHFVKANDCAKSMGDEPVLIAHKTHCPVVIDPNRSRACKTLLEHHACNIILSDDGLQHLALQRSIEIAVVDPERFVGNGFCLPAGPLREFATRLKTVDFVIHPQNAPKIFVNLKTKQERSLDQFSGQTLHGVAGIGMPERFFQLLQKLNCRVIPHAFADHFQFCPEDLKFSEDLPIIMTAKDAVKCEQFATQNMWYLDIDCQLDPAIESDFLDRVEQLKRI